VSAGQIDPHLHSKSYDFLPGMLRDELAGLKTAVNMAAKAERTCSWAEKPARAAEREMLEDQLGRLRTKLERTERETKEREVLAKVKREEREKREQGKGEWYMKKGGCVLDVADLRRETRPPYQGQVRGPGEAGWEDGCEEGDRKETQKDCSQGKEESSVWAGRIRRQTS
jgi:hypothetical protein